MKVGYLVGSLLAVALLGGLVAWAADEGGEVSAMRTQKGLGVAALTQGLASSERTAGTTGLTTSNRSTGTDSIAPTGSGNSTGVEPSGGAPLLQQGTDGITVQGYGSATADADAAIIEFYFSRDGAASDTGTSRSAPGSSGGAAEPAPAPELQEVAQITEADLQPVIDAIVSTGVARGDIEFIAQPYYDKYSSSATLRVNVSNVDSVDAVVKAATDAAGALSDIVLSGTNVSYTVNNCTALEAAAMRAAVEDANGRVAVFASALGVGFGSIVGASNYSYFGGTPCDPGFSPGPYPLAGVTYAEGQPRQVQVIANIAVTYAIQ